MPISITAGQAILFALILTRVLAMVMIAPVFGSKLIPLRFRLLLCILIAVLVAPASLNNGLVGEIGAVRIGSLLIGELALGLVFGLSLNLLFSAIALAGQQIASLCSAQFPGLPDDATGTNGAPIAKLYVMICLMVFLAIGGHRRVMTGLLESFRSNPPGVDHLSEDLLPLITVMLSQSFEFALRLGAPIVLSGLLAMLLLGIASRGMPQFNLMQSAFTINAFVVLLMMIAGIGTVELMIDSRHNQFQDVITETLEESAGLTNSLMTTTH